MSELSYWAHRIGLDRYARALNPFSRLSWPIRLRLLMIVPWRSTWNARVRDWTARLEGHKSYTEAEGDRPLSVLALLDEIDRLLAQFDKAHDALDALGVVPSSEDASVDERIKAFALGHRETPDTWMGGVERIAAERARQIKAEGWTPEHDDQHTRGELVAAAAAYVMGVPDLWPWPAGWKPSEAEIDRLHRTDASGVTPDA